MVALNPSTPLMIIKTPSLKEIDEIRQQGLRPQAVGCFICKKKLLVVFKKEHDLWQLPQGGIDNSETINNAFNRETQEELGQEFIKTIDPNIVLFGEDQIIFPPALHGSRELKTDSGQIMIMKGKKYFFVAAESNNPDIQIGSTEFDDYRWVSFSEGVAISATIQQSGKRRLTLGVLDTLKKLELIS